MGPPPLPSGSALFVMVVGPGEGRIATDTLDSIAACEPSAGIWVLDDCTSDGTYDVLTKWAAAHPGTRVLRNPAPRGYFGLPVSVFALLNAVAREPRLPEIVIKLDPDTYLVAPGLVDLIRQRFAAAGPGIVGVYRNGAHGRRDFRGQRRNILLDLLPVGLHKDRRSLRIGFPFWAPYLRRARQHGYEIGEHVLGALEGIHGETVRAIHDSGYFDAIPDRYRALTVEEDVLLGIGTRAVGHQLIDIAPDPDHPRVWIQFRPPIPHDAASLIERGMLVVHPLKGTPEGDEKRSVFRKNREAAVSGQRPASSGRQPAGGTQ